MLGELYHAKTGDARDFRDIGGHCDIVAILERFEHLMESGCAAFSVKFAVVCTRPADRADAELLRGSRIDLAVAVARNQNLGTMPLGVLDEWHQEVLAMPCRNNRRHLRYLVKVHGSRLHDRAAGEPDEAKIKGAERAHDLLEHGRGGEALK